jgi:hypothetical protein
MRRAAQALLKFVMVPDIPYTGGFRRLLRRQRVP